MPGRQMTARDALRRLVEEYADHKAMCLTRATLLLMDCDCGFVAVEAAAQAALGARVPYDPVLLVREVDGLMNENAALRARLAAIEEEREAWHANHLELDQEIDALANRLTATESALARYGRHEAGCETIHLLALADALATAVEQADRASDSPDGVTVRVGSTWWMTVLDAARAYWAARRGEAT